jgi:hypothetical protein
LLARVGNRTMLMSKRTELLVLVVAIQEGLNCETRPGVN